MLQFSVLKEIGLLKNAILEIFGVWQQFVEHVLVLYAKPLGNTVPD